MRIGKSTPKKTRERRDTMKITVLSENRVSHTECMGEHGLSVYIETGRTKILFDLGASDIFQFNAEKLKLDLSKVDLAIVSHGHYDHTWGMPLFCKLNKQADIYIHKDAFEETYGVTDGKVEEEPCSILWTKDQREKIYKRLTLIEDPEWITDDIVISGTIPELRENHSTETFFKKNSDGSFEPDSMNHEQFLAIRVRANQASNTGLSRGIFVFSGCSHKGVLPTIEYAKTLFPGEKIYGLLAGMHLYQSSRIVRRKVIEQVAEQKIDYVLPVHCTGIQAICELKYRLGESCIPIGAGDTISL